MDQKYQKVMLVCIMFGEPSIDFIHSLEYDAYKRVPAVFYLIIGRQIKCKFAIKCIFWGIMTFGVRKIDEEEIIYLLEIWPLDSLGTESIDSNAYFSP